MDRRFLLEKEKKERRETERGGERERERERGGERGNLGNPWAGNIITFLHAALIFGLYAPLKWRIVYSIPRVIIQAIIQERGKVLTCGFHGKFNNALKFPFQ